MERVDAGEDPDPSEHYFRTAPVFEAPEGEHNWLERLVAFNVGRRCASGVTYAGLLGSTGVTTQPGVVGFHVPARATVA